MSLPISDLIRMHATIVPLDVQNALTGDHLAIFASVYLFNSEQLFEFADALEKRAIQMWLEKIANFPNNS